MKIPNSNRKNRRSEATPHRGRIAVSLILSWFFLIAGWGLLPVLDWSHPGAGLLIASFHILIMTAVFCVTLLPLFLVLIWLWTRRGWQPLPLLIVIPLPALILFGLNATDLGQQWDSDSRFNAGVLAPVPGDATEFRSWHTGGGFASYLDLYYLEGPPGFLDSLIGGFQCEEEEDHEVSEWHPIPWFGEPPQGWPSPVTWEAPRFLWCRKNFTSTPTILMDGRGTRAYIVVNEGYRMTNRFRRGLPD